MKFTTVLGFISTFYSLAIAYVASPLAYSMAVPEWEIEVSPNTTIIARGTIQEVREEALKHNPTWDIEYIEPVRERVARDLESPSHLSKRLASDFDAAAIDCGGRWKSVEWGEALHGAIYLMGVKGKPSMGPGPGECGRVSCSYNTAIYWCNDNPQGMSLNSFIDISDGAMAILGQCTTAEYGEAKRVSGQAFNKAKWNVIVRQDKC